MKRAQTGAARTLIALVCAALACAPSGPTEIRFMGGARAEVTADGLHRVEALGIDAAYLLPGADFRRYREVLIEPVTVSYKSSPNPAGSLRRDRGNRELTPEEMRRMRDAFDAALESELSKSRHFFVATAPGPEVLRVAPHVVDLVFNTPVERGGERVMVSTSGEMTAVLELTDSLSLQPLGRITDRKLIQPGGPSGQLRRAGLFEDAEVERIFARWSRLLRRGLEDLAAYETVPPRETYTRP